MRSTLFPPALTGRRNLFALVLAVLLVAAPGSAWAAGASSDARQPPAPQAPPEQKFTSTVGLYYNIIKADKIADFEKFIARLHAAMAKTENGTRRKQAAGWRVFKSATADPQGNVVYLFWLDPVAADTDYTITKIMVDVFPADEVRPIFDSIKDAFVQQVRFNLDLVANFSAAPPAGMEELDLTKLDLAKKDGK